MAALKTNVLYYGDNLEILRHHIPDESVDLIYLDPPFNSNRSYNVLFKEDTGAASQAQIEAFEDTWHWSGAVESYDELQRKGPEKVSRMLRALVEGVGHNDVSAYLTMMAIRLVELERVLKPTGSIYLHCDPTAGPYLRVLMDAIFGTRSFTNEIVWKRSDAHSDAAQGSKHYGRIHDTILFYRKTPASTWNVGYTDLPETTKAKWYRHTDTDTDRKYNMADLTAAKPGGDTEYLWHVKRPFGGAWQADLDAEHEQPLAGWEYKTARPPRGRYWAYSRENMIGHEKASRIVYSSPGMPYMKRYLDESKGVSHQDIWADIDMLRGIRKGERLGYQTQKPQALLERIIEVSSDPGDVVLDPFCGCGTAIHAAQALGRQWIGIDITHLAINVMRRRMQDAFPGLEVEVIGEPKDLEGARALAAQDKYQFQWWALDKIDALPRAGKKKGKDKGIDGVIKYFANPTEEFKDALVSVKGGEQISSPMMRDLRGTMEREGAEIGIFLTLRPATRDMKDEAAAAGMYHSEFWDRDYPRIQILTIEEVIGGKKPNVPPRVRAYAKAGVEKQRADQGELEIEA